MGNLRRKLGLSIDNLLSVEIVTADGEVRHASATENSDLFWGVRGAGSNFGVITTFEFRLHPVGPIVYGATVIYPFAQAREIFAKWRDYITSAPDEVSSLALAWTVPTGPMFPPEAQGQPIVIITGTYCGAPPEGEAVLQPLRELGTPLMDLSGPVPYVVAQSMVDGFFPAGLLYYWKSLYLDTLNDEVIDTVVRAAEQRPSPMTMITFWQLGGAINRVGPSDTAFPHRQAPYLLSIDSTWANPTETEPNVAWTREFWQTMHCFSSGGLYLNFPGFGEEKDALVRAGYGPNYDRLVALKNQYDPGNLFRMNQNIKPAV
jgi:FAD/FMN-containing dehydrogenase